MINVKPQFFKTSYIASSDKQILKLKDISKETDLNFIIKNSPGMPGLDLSNIQIYPIFLWTKK